MATRSLHVPRRLSPDRIEDLFARQRAGDPVGMWIHTALAMVACFLAGWPTSFVEWAALPVLTCFAIRMTGWHGVLEPLAFDGVLRLLLAWGAWVGLSVLWSAARDQPETSHQWITDIQPLRFLALAVVLWPVMDRRRLLIGALVAGIACGKVSQIVHLVGIAIGPAWDPFHRLPGRISGWWDPVSGGTVLVAGLGLHLSAALLGRGRAARLFGLVGTGVTLACTALTGTRGAWIAAGLLVGAALAIAAWRARPRARLARPAAALGVIALLGIGTAWLAAGPRIADRFHRGVDEVRAALHEGKYDTDTGQRIAMWRWAIIEFRARPILGVGAGGYRPWAEMESSHSRPKAAELLSPRLPLPQTQAHSWFLHTAATLGVVGLGLLLALTGSAIASGLRTNGAPSATAPPSPYDAFDAGPALALIGLVCAGLFDSITVNQQPSYMFYLLIALCLPSRPRGGVAGRPA